MDSSTARCPQCGATIRQSARFCVTCGIKLPESTPPSGVAASGWATRTEEASQNTESVWAMPAPQATPTDESDSAVSEEDGAANSGSDQAVESDLPDSPETGSWLNWPEPDSELDSPVEPADEPEIQGEIGVFTSELPEDNGDEAEDEPEINGEIGAGESTEPPLDSAIVTGDSHKQSVTDTDEPESIVIDATGDELSDLDDESETIPDSVTSPGEIANETLNPFDDFDMTGLDSSTAPTDDIDQGVIETNEPETAADSDEPVRIATGAAGMTSNPAECDSLYRANALIDELRSLLPELAAPVPAPEPPRDLSGIRDRAVEARGEISFDGYAALREIVQEAQTRPRDVEVVLRLSRRVDDMDALLSEWDRLQQAFDQLIAELE